MAAAHDPVDGQAGSRPPRSGASGPARAAAGCAPGRPLPLYSVVTPCNSVWPYGIVHLYSVQCIRVRRCTMATLRCPGRGPAQALRRHGQRPRRLRPGRARRARSAGCSGPTAPARPPPCGSWPPCCGPTAAGPGWPASTWSARPPRSATASGWSASTPPSTRSSAAGRTWSCSAGSTTSARRAAGRRADELLERFGLAETGGKPVKQYSGGMRRRLDLAASLILAPPVLFLDEPTTGLDPRGRTEVWEAVRGAGRRRHHRAAHHPVPGGGRPAGRPDLA